ncbi:hypothetical protein B0H11DRAFT_1954576 [Mycena galericulata]|nr:hypothetical protein B0H11DRAFT_1991675 [Mycena galericulata]KAJ7511276.1 hypothetical protein B0H11DRAFT_1954576 [Mycena galericulata]
MFAPRFASILLLCASLISAGPSVAVTKRASNAEVNTILNTLSSSTTAPLNQISSLLSSDTLSDATVTPPVHEINAALNTATASLAALPGLSKRQTSADIANYVTDDVVDIVEVLEAFLTSPSTIPSSAKLLASVDTALSQVLSGVDKAVPGTLKVVGEALGGETFVPNLQAVGFTKTLALLGL